jgi:HNH endonuclease
VKLYLYKIPPSTSAATSSASQSKFKRDVRSFYSSHADSSGRLKCMILGEFIDSSQVIAGHIFRKSNKEDIYDLLGIEESDINNPRNGLLLFKCIKWELDHWCICFLYDSTSDKFFVKVLNPSLRTMSFKDHIINEVKDSNRLKHISPSILAKTFSEIDGKPLQLHKQLLFIRDV